jgi:hypothetical protein
VERLHCIITQSTQTDDGHIDKRVASLDMFQRESIRLLTPTIHTRDDILFIVV